MGAESRRGQMSAWLLKKKSGSSMVRMRQYNRRYFTVDFDSAVFFYAHNENSKKVRQMIPFADILEVRMVEPREATPSESGRGGSLLRRAVSFSSGAGTKEEQEQYLISVLTRPDKRMDLLCASAAEATMWCEALQAALASGGARPATTVPSGDDASGEQARNTADDSDVGPSGAPERPAPRGVVAAPVAAGAGGGAALAVTGAAAGSSTEGEESGPDGPGQPAPPVRGTLFDLTTDPEAPASAVPEAAGTLETVVEASPEKLQAQDFGFGEDSSLTSEPSSGSASPRSPGGPEAPTSAADAAASPGGGGSAAAAKRFSDHNEGLTMQERLANLEFSDCEDEDDDDPLGLKGAKSAEDGDG